MGRTTHSGYAFGTLGNGEGQDGWQSDHAGETTWLSAVSELTVLMSPS